MKTGLLYLFIFVCCHSYGQSSMGQLTAVEDGNNLIICAGEDFSFNVLGSVSMPTDLGLPAVNYDPGVGIAIFAQPPTYVNNELINDPNLLGIVLPQPYSIFLSPFVFNYSDLLALLPPALNPLPMPITLYFQATTLYDFNMLLPYIAAPGNPTDAAQSNVIALNFHPSIDVTVNQDCTNHLVEINVAQAGMLGTTFDVINTFPSSVVFPNNLINQTTTNATGFTGQNIPFGFDVVSNDGCVSSVSETYVGEVVATTTPVSNVCEGDSPFPINAVPSGGTWSGNANVLSAGTFNPSGVNINASTTYTLTYSPPTPIGGCGVAATLDITVNPDANSAFNYPTEICINDANAILQPINSNGVWSAPNNSVNTQGIFNPALSGPGLQTIVYAIGGACPSYTTHDIMVHDLPVIKFDASTLQGCLPLSVDFTNTTNNAQSNYVWTVDGNIQSMGSPNFNYTFENAYCHNIGLSLTDIHGCANSMDSVQIICPFPDPVVDFEYNPSQPSLADFEITFQETLGYTAVNFWDFGDGQSSYDWAPAHYFDVVVPSEFEVCLTGYDSNGCDATTCKFIQLSSGFEVYCPSAFTPGNDGVNDGFRPVIVSKKEVYKYRMQIFNRNGEKIFETDDYNTAWYGNSFAGNQYVQDGFYSYIIEITLEGLSERQTFKGNVLIVR